MADVRRPSLCLVRDALCRQAGERLLSLGWVTGGRPHPPDIPHRAGDAATKPVPAAATTTAGNASSIIEHG
ncbi:hypothetical protein GCM10023191_083870 [Actinoallomurus oryzae]|uniref:Uncharacterized protein n=1 Tax=Actinoallomurus oryzae TaxID=502180 RepID=A0ABP8R0B7_9ACTN